uniref:Nucleoside-diphosphate kinase n=1 Tax=Panthera leo TaxID=9689 RepID=A0A8C9D0U0_PANLE
MSLYLASAGSGSGQDVVCAEPLRQVLGLSFPLLTLQLPFLCPHFVGKPLVMFVLGSPSTGKGTQCAS